jgi:two-component system response regulator AtoC
VEVRQTYFVGRAEAARRANPGEISRAEEISRPEGRLSYGFEENRDAAQGVEESREAQAKLSNLNLERPAPAPAREGARVDSAYIAAAPVSRRLLEQIHKVAQSNATVLVRGENGVGKDLVASLLHYLGPNRDEPIARIDCPSFPPELLEHELFGHEKGAFHGAALKHGRLELVGSGTLILDEIAALTMPLQSRLLRVIEQHEYERIGGAKTLKFQGRILALTNVDLERAVARRSFREDLYYRLSVIQLVVPPLRERPDDILPLAEHFLAQLAQVHRRPKPALAPSAVRALQAFSHPGNVRQLRNIVEHVVVAGTGPEIHEADLPSFVRQSSGHPLMSLEELERSYIAEVLDATRGKKSKAAQILGISRKTLLEKRKRYGLD